MSQPPESQVGTPCPAAFSSFTGRSVKVSDDSVRPRSPRSQTPSQYGKCWQLLDRVTHWKTFRFDMAKIIAKQNDEYSWLNNLQVSPASQNDSGYASVVVCLANSTGSRITEAHLGPSRITHPGRSMRVFLEKLHPRGKTHIKYEWHHPRRGLLD